MPWEPASGPPRDCLLRVRIPLIFSLRPGRIFRVSPHILERAHINTRTCAILPCFVLVHTQAQVQNLLGFAGNHFRRVDLFNNKNLLSRARTMVKRRFTKVSFLALPATLQAKFLRTLTCKGQTRLSARTAK